MKLTTKPTPWTAKENELIVADYFAMLRKQQGCEILNKSKHRRELRIAMLMTDQTRKARSEASIEFKHRNISQVMNDFGYHHLKGYLPAANVQTGLREAVRAKMTGLAIPIYESEMNLLLRPLPIHAL